MDKTKIEWTDATWNPIMGCSPVSEGCRNCYAAGIAYRFGQSLNDPYFGLAERRGGRAVFNGTIAVVDHALTQPLRWRRPRRIFVNSMSDLFHEAVSFDTVDTVFAVMALTPQHTFQILTKRPERMVKYFKEYDGATRCALIESSVESIFEEMGWPRDGMEGIYLPLPNVWLGVSVEDQKTANERIPLLLACPAAVRFLSCEPLLGPVNIRVHESLMAFRERGRSVAVDWVIAGGESGPNARPMNTEWVQSLRDQCAESGVPFFFKQWGEYDERGERVGKRSAGRLLDGRTHDEFPRVVAEAR